MLQVHNCSELLTIPMPKAHTKTHTPSSDDVTSLHAGPH